MKGLEVCARQKFLECQKPSLVEDSSKSSEDLNGNMNMGSKGKVHEVLVGNKYCIKKWTRSHALCPGICKYFSMS